ncbi:MAG: hypothetical protein M1461_13070 [Nitrospirae bacterium]|nr:hypothetical protein [Nitrospirota bacterium]
MISVSEVVSVLKITDAVTVGEILLARKIYSNLQSARVNAQKKLNDLVALRQLERGDGYYRVPGCQSEYHDHARLLSKCIAEILKVHTTVPAIHREHTIPEIGLRPDAIVLLTKDNLGYCFILEVLINETDEYLRQKYNAWHLWENSLAYLSKLFGYHIPSFDIVPVTDLVGFITFLKEAL